MKPQRANENVPHFWFIYTRKSRYMDPEDLDDAELFRKHKHRLFRVAAERQCPVEDLETIYFQEVGSSETRTGRPVFSALMDQVAALPYPCVVHLIVMDQDRVSRAELGELGQILDQLKLKGAILHQLFGGDIDLTDPFQYNMAGNKGLYKRMEIEIYKAKKADALQTMLENGEIRQGQVPFGYWWDKSEKKVRDRIKIDDREEQRDRHPSEAGYGLTPWEKLLRICQEVRHVSIRQLSLRYHVSLDTLYSTLESPTLAGWPVVRTAPLRDPAGREIRDKHGRAARRKLPREKWIWPDKEGSYPKACTLQEWFEIDEIIDSRKHGRVKSGCGVGICKHGVRIEGCEGAVLLGRRMTRERPATYRQLGIPGQTHQRGSRDVERAAVDAAGAAAIKELVSQPEFFAWAVNDYYRDRKDQESEDTGRDMLALNRQIAKLKQDMETARRCIYEAESDAERRQYQSDVRSFQALIDERQKEKAALQTARSPIPAVDAAVPYLVALTREFDPGFWAEHWDAVWGRLAPTEQQLLIDMCIKEIPVLYQPPTGAECGKPSGWYNGKAKRVVLPVRYSDFIEGARAAWSRQRMSARKITSRR